MEREQVEFELVDMKQFARAVKLSTRTLKRYKRAGKLPEPRKTMGRRAYWTWDQIEAWVKTRQELGHGLERDTKGPEAGEACNGGKVGQRWGSSSLVPLARTLQAKSMFPDRETIFQISASAFERSAPNVELFEHLVREDDRVKGLSPVMIALLVRLCLILFAWWMASGTNAPSKVTDPTFPKVFEEAFAEVPETLSKVEDDE